MYSKLNITKKINTTVSEPKKNKYGQYFTPEIVANFMINLADIDKNSRILEPSCGKGVFLDLLFSLDYKNVIAFEIDNSLIPNRYRNIVRNESFINADLNEKFDLIIGNPPYIRWKNLESDLKKEVSNHYLWKQYFNSLCDYSYIFILKSIMHLKNNGQLIFITPEYWLNKTHSKTLREFMLDNGFFDEIYHFNETPIFENASVSIIIFKYIKSHTKKSRIHLSKYFSQRRLDSSILNNLKSKDSINNVEYFNIKQFQKNKNWLLTSDEDKDKILQFEKQCRINGIKEYSLFDTKDNYATIGDICDIGNGLVSGLDKAFQLNGESLNEIEKEHQLEVVKAKDLSQYYYHKITKYIYLNQIDDEDKLKDNFPNYFRILNQYRNKLESRYQYNKEIPYWKWVFLRNFSLFKSNKDRIFVPCKERISNKDYFRFSYAGKNLFPTQDVTAIFKKENIKESIFYILAFLNNHRVFDWLKHNGIVKGSIVEFSERPIASIPFRRVNWDSQKEKQIHSEIVLSVKDYIQSRNRKSLIRINSLFDNLLHY